MSTQLFEDSALGTHQRGLMSWLPVATFGTEQQERITAELLAVITMWIATARLSSHDIRIMRARPDLTDRS